MAKNANEIRARLNCVGRFRGRKNSKPESVLRRTLHIFLWGIIACICYICITYDRRLGNQLAGMPLGSWFEVRRYVTAVVFSGLIGTALFFVLGCLLYFVNHLRRTRTESDVFSIRRWPVVLVGLGLTVALRGLPMGQFPGIISLLPSLCGLMLGVWIASNCLRGVRTTLWLVPKFCAIAIAVQALGGSVLYLATSNESLGFEPRRISADEKASLARLIEANEHTANDNHRLSLTERDVDVLLALVCENLLVDVKTKARLRDGAVELDVSAKLPLGLPFNRYINSQGIYRIDIQDGNVAFWPLELRFGKLRIPAIALGSVGDFVVTKIGSDSRANAVISSIDRLRVSHQRMEVVYQNERFRQESKHAFRSLIGETPEVIEATSVHARHLVDFVSNTSEADEQFTAFLGSAFTFARERSEQGRDPVIENRAAILALAIVLGHYKVEALVGDVTDSRVRSEAKKYRGRVALRGRRDLTRHFFVSAGLAIIFDADVSDRVGLFKEEIDSAEGGSGFSFVDLLADHAGVRFAVTATRDRLAATRMQALLSNQFSVDDVFPTADDLPENLSDAAIQLDFGGVNGIVYKQVLADIERRLDTCLSLQKENKVF